jgi:hypothetical protein
MGGGQRRPRPFAELFGVVEQACRQFPVGIDRHRLGAGLVLERLRAFRLILRDGDFISAEIQPGAQRQREIGAVGGDAIAGKHPADRHRTEVGKEVDEEFAVHEHSRAPDAAQRATVRR